MSSIRSVKMKLLLHSAKQVVQVAQNREKIAMNADMNDVALLEERNGIGLSIVVDKAGFITAVGYDDEIQKNYANVEFDTVINATGLCVLPGFIDAHTHPVWAGDRVHEFAMKLAGATYMDIHKAGGGINFTVEKTRQATEEELFESLKERLKQMLRAGTTTVECKSGYGLDTLTEMKMLFVLEKAKKLLPIEISSTYCGAHAVPVGKTAAEATTNVIEEQLPKLKSLIDAGELHVDSIDVFCEKGVFDIDQTKEILLAGREMGLKLNFHGDELHGTKSAEMGAALGAEAISHLEKISPEGIKAMAKSKSVAVMLPSTAYMLRLEPPPVREMIDAGVPIALGSDFNPNAYVLSMPLAMHFACVLFKMSMAEALNAATLNAAAALGKSDTHGSIEVGKVADLVLVNAPRWEHIIYQMGGHEHIVNTVIKRGTPVYMKSGL